MDSGQRQAPDDAEIIKADNMILTVKNMVCPRCIMAVEEVLQLKNIAVKSISLGKVEIEGEIDAETMAELDRLLRELGFEIVRDHNDAVVEQIKAKVIEMARAGGEEKLSTELASALGMDYSQVSRIFTAHEGRSIEKFYIAHKIERVKELLEYNELSVKEIAYRLGYSSVAHLSRQFKQTTGVTPTEYKQSSIKRKPLTDV